MERTPTPSQLDLFDDWLILEPLLTEQPQVAQEPLPVPSPVEVIAEPSLDAQRHRLALTLATKLNQDGEITRSFLTETANRAFGGTQAEGRYSTKDAYDAMEAAFNLHLVTTETADWIAQEVDWAQAKAAELTQRIQRLPTQTRRDAEMEEYQQFSTPPALAFVANWVANIQPSDRMLEPSAGTGDLAIWSHIAGADIVLNELAPRRHALLAQLFPDASLFRENAEQIDNVLPRETVPSVIVMNPPFSSTAGRVEGQRDTANGARHIEQALRRLADGGRLVAIVGQGMAADRPAFRSWWREIEAKYTVRANIGINGREYAKYGTSFDNQILVIDKTGPTLQPVLTGQVASVAELPALLETIRHDRQHLPHVQRGPVESTGGSHSEAEPDPVRSGPGAGDASPDPRSAGTEFTGDADDSGTHAVDSEVIVEPGPGDVPADGIGTGGDIRDELAGEPGGIGGHATGGDGGLDEHQDGTGIAIEASNSKVGEFSDSVFASYTPQRLTIPAAHAHPGKLVQSAAMSAVEPPSPSYSPSLPPRVVRQGLLSIAQLESIIYAGQAHSELLPNGSRKGFFIGDGTGVGKGREISGIILDNLMQGRKKAVWVSFNEGLINDARRDFSSIGGDPERIFFQGKTKAGNEIAQPDGILFTTYSTLRGGEKKQATDQGQSGGKTRLQQMVEWLGKDFDGVIAFDEAHSMGNAIAIKAKRGVRKPSQQALAGINLQRELPNARVVYVSATGATEVSNLSYADRLGLWGEGTPFADVNAFVSGVSAGGIAAMELISRDMKAMGMYLARSLSYDGVTYERMEHTLSELQEDIYNELAGAWQIVLNNVEKALEITQAGKSGPGKSAAMAQFWGAHQRFFNQIITAMQTPAVIEHIRQQIDTGHVAVIQIVNTNEAAQERIIADATVNDAALEDLDFTPRQMLMDYVRNGFPVAAFEESTDINGNTIYVAVRDSEGNQVFDREAIALRDALLSSLQHIRVPENPLDSIINAFGPDLVAEVTGRGRRFVQIRDDEGNLRVKEEKRGKNSSRVDADLFMQDKKKILVFSGAGGTGYSFHADNTAQNTRKRIHYILQPGWRADAAVQGFGRTHRTNQASEPHYVLPTTNLKAQKRFVSSIARRLDQLGALTRGQRQATSQGMFTAADNLESEYAKVALYNFFVDLYRDRMPLDFQTVTRQMGLALLDKDGAFEESRIPDIPQFLNRLLSLKTDQQNGVFDEFEARLIEAVEYAKQRGLYDEGLQTLHAVSIQKTRDEVAYEDARTGAQTRYVELAVTQEIAYLEWAEIVALARNRQLAGKFSGWFVSEHGRTTGEVFFLDDRGERLNSDGIPTQRGVVYGIKKGRHRYIDNADVLHRGWEYRIVNRTSTKVTLTRPIDAAEAERLWNAQIEAAPKTETETSRMLVGVILPIWDRVEGAETIFRLQTDEGEQLLGRLLGPNAAKQTLKNLGLDSAAAKMSLAELFAAIQSGQRAILSNGWEISTARVNGEHRVEIKGRISDAEKRLLATQGAFMERINWQERLFIPTGDLAVFERITASKPVIDLFESARNASTEQSELKDTLSARLPDLGARPFSVPEGPAVSSPGQSSSPTTDQDGKPMAEKASSDKKSFAQTVAEKLIAQLERGVAPWQIPWESAPPGSTVPMNPTTGKRYRGINAVYLMAQDFTDQRWMTYKQAAALGAQVRKGERGTPIQYWKFTEQQSKRDEEGRPILDEDGKPETVTVTLERPRVFFATVFNAEQIDGLPPLERKPVEWDALARAEHILQASGADIRYALQDQAFYRPSTDSIHLPDKGQFASADRFYGVALHELGHWSGGESRLARDLSHPFGSEMYAKEELRAEIASMMLGDELGIGHDPGQHAAYVGSWIKALKEDPLEIFRAAADAEKIHAYVLGFEQKQVQDIEQQQPAPTVADLTARHYQAMKAADEAYQEELVRVYGTEKAGDARYQERHQDMAAQAARENYQVAAEAWRDAVAQARRNQVATAEDKVTTETAMADDSTNTAIDYEAAVRFARAEEERIKTDPNSTKEDILTAREARKTAEAVALLNDPDMQRRIAEQEKRDSQATNPDRLYINVPFRQKDEAKSLGAQWDRARQSWYVPAGVDPRPFAKWRQDQDTARERAKTTAKRRYLAVPFSERNAAKAAGALWDKQSRSWYAGPSADMSQLRQWLPENVPVQQGPAMSPAEEFAEALEALGCLVTGEHPIMDGQRHRIAVEGDRKGEKAGFYVAHLDGHPAAYAKNNRTGVEIKWKSKGYALDQEEKAKLSAEAAEKLQQREAEQTARRVVVTEAIRDLLAIAPAAPGDHPYLVSKQARPGSLKVVPQDASALPDDSMILIGQNWRESKELRDANPDKLVFTAGDLLLPAQDINGQIVSVQSIQANGAKRFAKDSAKTDTFHVVGGDGLAALEAAPVIVISEGYATADTVSKALGQPVVSAFDSGNLPHVARLLHDRFPAKPIIVAGDDDLAVLQEYGHNPGRDKAEEAAQAVGGQAIFPIFAPSEQAESPKAFTDFNDLAVKSSLGSDAVERQIRSVVHAVVRAHQQGGEQGQQEVYQAIAQRRSVRR